MKVNQDKKKGLHGSIREKAACVRDPAGRSLQALNDHEAFVIADEYHIGVHAIYIEMLKMGIYPYRYIRNLDAISPEEQLKLAESKIAVIGAGGLGGNVILLLARVGIGSL